MRIAVGILGLIFSLIALLQSCTITGLSGMVEDNATSEAGAIGMLTAILMLFGGAFYFGMPKVVGILFLLGFLISIPAWESFPDSLVWGVGCAILGSLILLFGRKAKPSSPAQNG